MQRLSAWDGRRLRGPPGGAGLREGSTDDPKAARDCRVSQTGPIDLVLASASPRRAELLTRIGLRLRIAPAEIDETPQPEEKPLDYARRMAAEKSEVIQRRLTAEGAAPLPVLA